MDGIYAVDAMSTSTTSTHLPDHYSIWVLIDAHDGDGFIYNISTSPRIEKFLYYENMYPSKIAKKVFLRLHKGCSLIVEFELSIKHGNFTLVIQLEVRII